MRSLGTLNLKTKTGSILIRTKELPQIYSNISTKDGNVVGKVSDIIGPIMDPHVVVKPNKAGAKNLDKIMGQELFETPKRKSKRDRKWKKKG